MQGMNTNRNFETTACERRASENSARLAKTKKTRVDPNQSILLTFGVVTLKVNRWVRP
jgi:hypothetical protein